MRFSYYTALCEEAKRIEEILNVGTTKEIEKLKKLSDKWRDTIFEKLYTDFLPPIERRDLLAIVQNMGYIAYEVEQLAKIKGGRAESLILKEKLQKAIAVFIRETSALEGRCCNSQVLRNEVYALLTVWRDLVKSGGDRILCDGYEAVSDALLRYADTLEAVCVLV